MVEPQTEYETEQTDPLYPFVKRGIFAGVDKFDEVHKPTKKTTRQFYNNLPGIKDDLRNFLKILNQYEFSPDEIQTLIQNNLSELNGMIKRLCKLMEEKPHQTVLVLSCYSSHGMIQDGRQVILVNEFDSKRGFYRLFAAE